MRAENHTGGLYKTITPDSVGFQPHHKSIKNHANKKTKKKES
jgi:hypothetical protein